MVGNAGGPGVRVGEAKPVGEGARSHRLVQRPRLMTLLDETQSRHIVLVAPAGYGKTTLARQWFTRQERRAVWFRAGPASTDVAALAHGLAHAAQDVLKGSGARLQEHLRTSHSPNSEVLHIADILVDDLAGWPADLWMVIDDYQHLAHEQNAEKLIDAVVARGTIPLFVTSRIRPSWVSAKRLLYGEVAEFGRNILAMTHEEATRAVPRKTDASVLAGLMALAEGWPAVIGLASLVQSPKLLVGDEIPEALHSYFAEELYQELSDELQWKLTQLSLSTTIDVELAQLLFGTDGRLVLEEAFDRGFLNRDGETYDLHPLLRQFLRSKMAEADSPTRTSTVETIAYAALGRLAWDEAFALANEFRMGDLLNDLLTEGLDDLLSKGRLATLERWLEEAHKLIPSAEIAAFAEVELAFRKGRWAEAEDRARHLAMRLPQAHALASRVLFRAAQVAQLDDRPAEALELLSEARVRSTSSADLRRVLWSRFLAFTDLEEPVQAAEALKEFEKLAPESVEDKIRLSHGPIHFALRWGGIRQALERHRSTLELLDRTPDPVVRSGFLQSYGTALNLAARYSDAYSLSDRQIDEAKRFGLDWVGTHALELKALAQMGMRDFQGAQTALRTAWRLADAAEDLHAQVNAQALLARMALAQGAPTKALELLDMTSRRSVGPGMEGEVRSIRALALACSGAIEDAEAEIAASESITTHLEARGLRGFAKVFVADRRGDEGARDAQLELALVESHVAGNADSFVVAYRMDPELLNFIVGAGFALTDFLLRPLVTYDPRLAQKAGLNHRETRIVPSSPLTDREAEVLDLLRQGMSNQEIARTLWIAQSTAKVHVRHIFEKLGVRSRTEAALFQAEP
jgi:LuxR family transcriptional regulator, maltose regulon positive regulatory protein